MHCMTQPAFKAALERQDPCMASHMRWPFNDAICHAAHHKNNLRKTERGTKTEETDELHLCHMTKRKKSTFREATVFLAK